MQDLRTMKKKYSMLAVAIPAIVAVILLSATVPQSPVATESIKSTPNQLSTDLIKQVDDVGGLVPLFSGAFAQVPLDQLDSMKAQGRKIVEVNLVAQAADLPIMGGGKYHALTFNGQVPGPTIRVTQGDIIKVTLTVPSTEATAHSVDLHASQISATNFGAVKPGQSETFAFIAETPGQFKYHCEGVNVASMDQHVFSGMYGLTIVDPLNGYTPFVTQKTDTVNGQVVVKHLRYEPDAKEFVLEFNQLYLTADGSFDETAMFLHNTTQTTINGFAFGYVPNADINKLIKGDPNKNIFVAQPWNSPDLKQYQSHPLFVDTGVHYRLFVENEGQMPVFFHIVGEQLDRVVQGNRIQAQGTETWLIGGSQGATVDVVFDNPGVYVAVNHDYAAIFTGAGAVFVAGDPFNLGYKPGDMPNPSDAVPPLGKNSIPQKEVLHCLCTDERAAELAKTIGA